MSKGRFSQVKQWREENKDSTIAEVMESYDRSNSYEEQSGGEYDTHDVEAEQGVETESERALEGLQSIFYDEPATLVGLQKWSERLQAVPYTSWTLGAATALDHWMARQVLGWDEGTWLAVLEGDTSYEGVDVLALGRQLLHLRETLFPETRLESDTVSSIDNIDDSTSGSALDDFLTSLGDLFKDKKSGNEPKAETISSDKKCDELQVWRWKHHEEQPYSEWSDADKTAFDNWLTHFLRQFASPAEQDKVDRAATRDALLKSPPMTRAGSDRFWEHVSYDVVELLEVLREHGPPADANYLHKHFWDLSYDEQLSQLLQLGSLKPLLDDFASSDDKTKFLQQHSDTLLEGVVMEHLVVDPKGNLSLNDLNPQLVQSLNLPPDTRFKVERRPYRASSADSDDAANRTKLLLEAWNEYKMGRAQYEEKMFVTGRLGLRYSDPVGKDE
jgi:hypothetical protein